MCIWVFNIHTHTDVGSTPTSRAGDYFQRRRHSIRLKRSPLSSPLPSVSTAAQGGSHSSATAVAGVIKFEPSSGLDDNEDKFNLRVTSGGGGGGGGMHSELDDDDDELESEQPCDLRLSRNFKLNLVSMALQQAAAAAGSTVDQNAAAAMAAAMITGGSAGASVAGGTSGMPQATQLQHAALHTIAAVATHQAPVLHGLHAHQQHGAGSHAFMNFPPHAGATSPKRRYSTSSSGGGAGAVGASGLLNVGSAVAGGSTISATGGAGSGVASSALSTSGGAGPSTSSIVAPHTPSSTGNSAAGTGGSGSSSGGAGGQSGPGSGGASGGGVGGSGGSLGAGTNQWGGAYTCDRCGNSYARPHSLNRHVRFECGVEPKFECPICHKKSKHKHNLVLHMRTHQHR